MVCSDGSRYAGAAGAYGFESGGGTAVLEDDAEFGEFGVQRLEGWEECGFRVEDGDGGGVF
jgi:hypothetical protein